MGSNNGIGCLLCLLVNDSLQVLADCAIAQLLFATSSTRRTSIVHVTFDLMNVNIDKSFIDRKLYFVFATCRACSDVS